MQKILNKENFLLLFFIVLKFILQYQLISPEYDLQRDEYLHIDQGYHLALGYLSVPPFTSWISALIILLGKGIFWIKFFPAFFGVLTLIVVWKTIKELNGGLFSMSLGATAVLLSAILRLNILFQPNSADVFFWTLLYFLIIKYINNQNVKWLYCAAMAFGFGFLNKYNIVFLMLGLFPAMIFSSHRNLFLKREFYIAMFIGFLIILPNLYWQYDNGFPVIHHMKELAETQLVNVNRIDFIKEQLTFFIGSLFLIILAFVALCVWLPFKKYRFYFIAFLITMSLFTWFKAKGYYAIGIYPVFLAFGAVYLENLLRSGRWIYVRPLAFLLVIAPFYFIVKIAFPIYSPQVIASRHEKYQKLGMLRWEDGKDHEIPQDFADMIGWKELAAKTDSAYAEAGNGKTLVLCDNYGEAGAVNYYSKRGIKAVSMNADYINWISLDQNYENVVLIQESDDDDKERKKERPFFQEVKRTGCVENKLARECGTCVYLLKGAKVSVVKLLKKEISAHKNY